MTENREKNELLNRILATASETWGAEEAETLRPTLESAVEAFWIVEAFPLAPMEEPAHPASILHHVLKRRDAGTKGT